MARVRGGLGLNMVQSQARSRTGCLRIGTGDGGAASAARRSEASRAQACCGLPPQVVPPWSRARSCMTQFNCSNPLLSDRAAGHHRLYSAACAGLWAPRLGSMSLSWRTEVLSLAVSAWCGRCTRLGFVGEHRFCCLCCVRYGAARMNANGRPQIRLSWLISGQLY